MYFCIPAVFLSCDLSSSHFLPLCTFTQMNPLSLLSSQTLIWIPLWKWSELELLPVTSLGIDSDWSRYSCPMNNEWYEQYHTCECFLSFASFYLKALKEFNLGADAVCSLFSSNLMIVLRGIPADHKVFGWWRTWCRVLLSTHISSSPLVCVV